jgi:hypothetical protein
VQGAGSLCAQDRTIAPGDQGLPPEVWTP